MQPDQTLEIFNVILSITSIVVSLNSFILSLIFFWFGYKEQKEANKLFTNTVLENTKNLEIIKGVTNSIEKTGHETHSRLLDFVLTKRQNEVSNRLARIDEELPNEGSIAISDLKVKLAEIKEYSKNSLITMREGLDSVVKIVQILNSLTRPELKTLYLLHEGGINKQISINDICEISGVNISQAKDILNRLQKLSFINTDNKLNKQHFDVLSNLFDIDEYSGMSVDEKVNTISEQLERLN